MPAFYIDNNQVEHISGVTNEYPYSLHITDLRDWIVPWHWHEELELNYVTEGAMKVTTVNASYLIHAGEAFFINTNVLETKEKAGDYPHIIEYAHLFHPTLLSGNFRSIYETKYLNPVLKNRQIEVVVITPATENGRKIIRKLKETAALQEKENVEFETRNLLSEAWLLLMDEIRDNYEKKPVMQVRGQDRIRYLLTFIHQHYAEKISLKEIADSAGIGERECLRCFRKNLGRSPFDYLLEYRLDKSREALLETAKTVTEIALESGFSDSAYFGKTFRKYYRMTPGQFRSVFRTQKITRNGLP